ncbi:unnamed protein product [Lymnaea stagnalis]|uniref:Chitin-binding type-4 domain-containing protein n=1 Tax=Lymnaea stagnalis TaxID=6523 RepID=A0AAV2HL44_LYMST
MTINMTRTKMCTGIALLTFIALVDGHGRLIDPPARSSMWRFGFKTPINHDDMSLYCGGFYRQWTVNKGRCGLCGDPYDGPREQEAGGKYATGTIARTYRQGDVIPVAVQLTQSHLGWFEFRLCPSEPATQDCLDSHLLPLANGSRRYTVLSKESIIHNMTLRLPYNVSCSHCVLQWKYNTGNSWGCEEDTSKCCLGCGPQEQYFGCADVAILHPEGSKTVDKRNNTTPR